MTGALLAVLAAAGPRAAAVEPARPGYGLLLLAQDAGAVWKRDLAALRAAFKGRAVESVGGAADPIALQRAVERLERQRPGKIVAVSLEPLSESPLNEQARFLLGVREQPAPDLPDAEGEGLSGGRPRTLVLERERPRWLKRVRASTPIVLAATMDQSPALAAMLAERARKLSRDPRRATVLLVGQGPRSDKALRAWQAAAEAVAEQVRARGGFARGAALHVRDGVRAGQRERDRAAARAKLSELAQHGPVVAVPLAPDGRRLERMLRQAAGSAYYRWDGKGVLGDARLADWIRGAADAAARRPDGRRYKDIAPGPGANFGGMR